MIIEDIMDMQIRQQFVAELFAKCSKDWILVKEIRVTTNPEGYSVRITFDADYQEFDTLAEAAQHSCQGDSLICRADYLPVSDERKQELTGEIDESLISKT